MAENNQAPRDADEIEIESSNVLATLSKAEIDIQIATAKQYPRSIDKFKKDALQLATLDEQTAGSMFYRLPRDGRTIEGPSVRLAEVVGSCWGNLRYGGRVVDIDEHFVTAQGMAFDLEKNLASTIEVRRRITDKYGRRYKADMITVTANAAMSVALRNAIFKVVPFAFAKGIFEECKKVSLGKGMTMEQRRERAFEALAKFGAKPADVLKVLHRKAKDDVTIDDLITLQGIHTAISDGDTIWADVLDSAKDMSTPLDSVADNLPESKPRPAKDDVAAVSSKPAAESVAPSPPAPRPLTSEEVKLVTHMLDEAGILDEMRDDVLAKWGIKYVKQLNDLQAAELMEDIKTIRELGKVVDEGGVA